MIVFRSRTMHPQSSPLTIDGTVLKESDDLDILGMTLILSWHLILSWPLRSIFTRSPEQLLKDLVSWGSPGEYSLIGCSSGDSLGVLSCQFWNTVLQCGVRLPIHTLNYWTGQSVVPAFQLVACLTVIFLIVDLWQCCVCCTRLGVTQSTYFVELYLCLMCRSGLHVVLLSHIGVLMRLPTAEPHSTAGLLFPSQYLSGTI